MYVGAPNYVLVFVCFIKNTVVVIFVGCYLLFLVIPFSQWIVFEIGIDQILRVLCVYASVPLHAFSLLYILYIFVLCEDCGCDKFCWLLYCAYSFLVGSCLRSVWVRCQIYLCLRWYYVLCCISLIYFYVCIQVAKQIFVQMSAFPICSIPFVQLLSFFHIQSRVSAIVAVWVCLFIISHLVLVVRVTLFLAP